MFRSSVPYIQLLQRFQHVHSLWSSRFAIFSAQFNLCQKICDAQSTMEADDRPGAGSVRHSYSKYLRCFSDIFLQNVCKMLYLKYYSYPIMKQATCLQRFGWLLFKHIMLDVEGAVQMGVSGKDGETISFHTSNNEHQFLKKNLRSQHLLPSDDVVWYVPIYIYIYMESEFVFRVFQVGELWYFEQKTNVVLLVSRYQICLPNRNYKDILFKLIWRTCWYRSYHQHNVEWSIWFSIPQSRPIIIPLIFLIYIRYASD